MGQKKIPGNKGTFVYESTLVNHMRKKCQLQTTSTFYLRRRDLKQFTYLLKNRGIYYKSIQWKYLKIWTIVKTDWEDSRNQCVYTHTPHTPLESGYNLAAIKKHRAEWETGTCRKMRWFRGRGSAGGIALSRLLSWVCSCLDWGCIPITKFLLPCFPPLPNPPPPRPNWRF